MFPLTNKEPYIKSSGGRTTLGDMFAQAGSDISELEHKVDGLKEALTDEVETRAALGAHNLNGTKYIDSTYTNMTYTANADNTVTLSITGSVSERVCACTSFIAPITAQVVLTGGISAKAHAYVWDNTDNARPYTNAEKTTRQSNNSIGVNSEVPFYMEKGHEYQVYLRTNASATTSDSGTFYPMIRLATDSYPTYQPYAPTNLQLENNKIDVSQIAPIENGTTASTNYAQGAYFIHNGKFCKAKTSIASGATFTKGTNYEETTVAAELIALA